ncbi:MAG: SUMF1/EgtB/PvdO family nonheme iron enzyme [Deltaproteobacteria bacterium]|nr:SUMF1/EgtB/PvdO family nonheme iron enzyme [Deltaproteobacteria bacterium]
MKRHWINGLVTVAALVTGLWLMMTAVVFSAAPVESPAAGSLVLIPAGEFNMGDPYKEGDLDEIPVHKVFVSAFYLEKYPVTGKQWKDVYDWAKDHGYGFDHTGSAKADDHPVYAVCWCDVLKWLNARSEKEGRTPAYYTDTAQTAVYRTGQHDVTNNMVKWTSNGYRLPTEAEWEKAARGGLDGHHYPWPGIGGRYSDHIDCSKANYYGCNGGTTPIGNYKANGYDLYDMAGNVWDWVWDWFDSGWYGKPGATGGDTRGPDSGSNRVVRGGAWSNDAPNLRSAERLDRYPNDTGLNLGFRTASGRP